MGVGAITASLHQINDVQNLDAFYFAPTKRSNSNRRYQMHAVHRHNYQRCPHPFLICMHEGVLSVTSKSLFQIVYEFVCGSELRCSLPIGKTVGCFCLRSLGSGGLAERRVGMGISFTA
jgi:hypothetical protein